MNKKERRERDVLLALVELYLETGKPIGSNTLKEEKFPTLSSATIRNYFAKFEKLGYLKQPHSSGGRLPTEEGIRLYVAQVVDSPTVMPEMEMKLKMPVSKSIHTYLQRATEKLSELTGCAAFLSAVRFDHDFIQEVKLVGIDEERILCVVLTDFGQVLTEILAVKKKLSSFVLKRIESYLQWRIKGGTKPEDLKEDETLAQQLYSEIVVRYMVRYSNFSEEDVYRTGFSRLLNYPEFSDPVALSSGLSLFENAAHMRLLLSDCMRENKLCYWIGSDLAPYAAAAEGCAVLTIPYHIGETRVGAVGLLGASRMPYQTLFGTLQYFSETISEALTKTLYKYKLSFRQPRAHRRAEIDQSSIKLLENK